MNTSDGNLLIPKPYNRLIVSNTRECLLSVLVMISFFALNIFKENLTLFKGHKGLGQV